MNKFNILLLDDIPENIYSLEALINENFDVKIFKAYNAHQGIELLVKENIDLILSDIQMPDINGFEFVEYVKQIDKLKTIPIIFITGINNSNVYIEKGYDYGAVDYITKPINDKLLNSKLSIYINLFKEKKYLEKVIDDKNALIAHQSRYVSIGENIDSLSKDWLDQLNNMDFKNDSVDKLKDSIETFRYFCQFEEIDDIVDIKEILNNFVKLLTPILDKKSIKLELLVDDFFNEAIIKTNAADISQILLNQYRISMEAFDNLKIDKTNPYIKILCKCDEDHNTIIEFIDNATRNEEEVNYFKFALPQLIY